MRDGARLLWYSPGTNTRVGHDGPVALEAVRFRPDVSLAFPVSDIVSIESISTKDDPLPRFQTTQDFIHLRILSAKID
ncbi:MAG: type VI secretion system baseplate subunit TssG, partial [Planctomycetes bacterium]|nr:type VI secretion system baseplate subunit TssG [Planctomycetota bacterium]